MKMKKINTIFVYRHSPSPEQKINKNKKKTTKTDYSTSYNLKNCGIKV